MTLDADRIDQPVRDPVSSVLKWVLLFVAVATFALLAWATVVTYRTVPPQPERFVTAGGAVVLSAGDIAAGKGGFQKADLMDYGSLYGMGSYYGEDYTASTLVQLGTATRENIARMTAGTGFDRLPAAQQAAVTSAMQRALQGIDLTQREVVLPDAVATAVTGVRDQLASSLAVADPARGWTPAYSLTPGLAQQTADFLIYSALTTVARRPGVTWSWTENWPYEPLVGNTPTTNTFRWTWISFCFTFLAFGVVLFIYEFFLNDPDEAPMDPVLATFQPLTPSQRRVWKYFLVVAVLLLVQIAAGSIMAHSYYDRTSFYGIAINDWLPFNFLRDVHIQAPIVWIGLSWIGAALFLAPAIAGGREAKGQHVLVELLFWVTLVIVAGALIGNYLGIMGVIDWGWFWFGNQGLSYIQLGRFWQIGFFIGLALWSVLVMRALWPDMARWREAAGQFWRGRIRLEHLIWASTINIAVLYVFGMIPLTGIEKSFTLTDFWRWWVVHLWVEQSFEFFAACMSAYLLMAVGLVSRRLAERATYFEIILVFLGGVIGTGHHLYWAGGPSMWVPMGSMFSFIEVLPLVLLIIEAINHYRLISRHSEFQYRLAYTYIIGAAFWNFVGAGVFGGGTLNAPLVNYYEHGTFLTLNHAHTALFGAFGELAIGLIYFCLRYAHGERAGFGEKAGLWAFWLYNAGMVLWILLNFFPIGWPQLDAVYEHGLAYARSSAFYDKTLFWQWMRLPGDVVFAAGALLMAWDFIIKLRPLYPQAIDRMVFRRPLPGSSAQSAE
ncbi:nitric-oxide reductase large subunit [Burkholderia multivorans]|uniref:nitric-oxide reductase large subunit n=1 Tax=Burkholderia multivorans TaxID=87883 RepID=UPI001C2582FE|nr:cbb3-type cytochrome c oxidase subunit I [Burkholderia multivorans]MBU9597637.1 cbb3-type cytochrome c oxidase subunit I [Burkholderia multivorans]MDN8000182.1 cbb3-type cytochrome c oxidase subunit I [Burkholderia multivorans]